MELIARGDTWAAARAELEGVTGVLASDGGKELVGGEVAALCVKAEVGGGAGGGKGAEVLGRGKVIDAGEIRAVEHEVHMAAARRGGGGETRAGHGETPKLGDERAERTRTRALDISGLGWQRCKRAGGRVRETHEEGWRRDSWACCIANSRAEAEVE